MAQLEAKTACVWHAFNALKEPGKDGVDKGKLKVLTFNIAHLLGLIKIEEKLANYDTELFTFPSYIGFIRSEIFNNFKSEQTHANSSLEKVDEICWMLCCCVYNRRTPVVLDEGNTFILWKIFNTLADIGEDKLAVTPVVVDREEVGILAQKFCQIVGTKFDTTEFGKLFVDNIKFDFKTVLNYFEKHLCHPENSGIDLETTHTALKELRDEFVYEVIKKGMLTKKGQKIMTLRDRFFVLTPTEMKYYTSTEEKELKGSCPINPLCKAEPVADNAKGNHRYKFRFFAPSKSIDILTPDIQTRSDWITAIRIAIDYCKKAYTPQQRARQERRQEREERRKKEQEDEERRRNDLEMINKTKEELEAQRKACLEAEARAKEEEERRRLEEELSGKTREELEAVRKARAEAEARIREDEEKMRREKERLELTEEELLSERQGRACAEARLIEEAGLREAERKRLDELEALKLQLELLLDEERRAKKDEEIVRNLQAIALAEELDRREQLEQIQEELQQVVREEQEKREGLEESRQHLEDRLREEKSKLEQVQMESQQYEQSIKDAEVKLEEAERAKFQMAEKLSMKQKAPVLWRAPPDLPDDASVPFKPGTHHGKGFLRDGEFITTQLHQRSLDEDMRKLSVDTGSPFQKQYSIDMYKTEAPLSPSGVRDDDSGIPSEGSTSGDNEDSQHEVFKQMTP